MKLFDRFLLKEFGKYLVLSLVGVVAIYLLFDLMEDLDYFTNHRAGLLTVLRYYLYRLPSILGLLLPVGAILGSIFVVSRLTQHHELWALQSAGINLHRIFLPFLGVSSFLTVVSFLGNELWAVEFNSRLQKLKRYEIEGRQPETYQRRRHLFYYGEDGRIYYIKDYDGNAGVIQGFTIWEFELESRRVVRRIDGELAQFRDGVWRARGVKVRRFNPDQEEFQFHPVLELADLKEAPADFGRRTKELDEMNFLELGRYASKMRRAGEEVWEEAVEYHYRFSYPFIVLVVVFLALPLATLIHRGGVTLGLGLGLLISFLYWGVIQVARALGVAGLISPQAAAWYPNLLFGGIGVYLFFFKVRR